MHGRTHDIIVEPLNEDASCEPGGSRLIFPDGFVFDLPDDLGTGAAQPGGDVGPVYTYVGAAARADGATELSHVVAVGNDGRGVKSPCRRDRQILADHHPHARVILPGPDGLISVTATDLLPLAIDHGAEQP